MSMKGLFIENCHVIAGTGDSADMFNTGPNTEIINCRNFEKVAWLITTASLGTNTGTGNIKVMACDNKAGANPVAIFFRYAKKTTGASDVWGPITNGLTASGVETVAGESTLTCIEVDCSDVPDGKQYMYLDTTEVVNDPVGGSVLFLGLNPKYGYPHPTALT